MADKNFELINPASGKKSVLPVRSGTIGPDVLDIASIAISRMIPASGLPPPARAGSPTSTVMPAC
jgi:hypothetical protein